MASSSNADFIVWGVDQTAYGPVELPALVSWVKDERVTADTWIYVARTEEWHKAPEVPELQMFFRSKAKPAPVMTVTGVDPRALQRIKILAGMSEAQLQRFA